MRKKEHSFEELVIMCVLGIKLRRGMIVDVLV